jgi:hypothetical protein
MPDARRAAYKRAEPEPRPASSDDDAAIADQDSGRIEPGLDPPAAPAFDRAAIWAHVQTLFHLAKDLQGKFVVLALTGNKADAPYWIGHFKADGGEAAQLRMWQSICLFDPSLGIHPDGRRGITHPLNMYVSWALYHPEIPPSRQGQRRPGAISYLVPRGGGGCR